MSLLKPEASLGVGLAVMAMVGAVYVNATPPLTDIRAADPNDKDVEAARKVSLFTSIGLVGGVSILAKDPTVFVMGGAITIALDWWLRHANQVVPGIGKASVGASKAAAEQESAPDIVPSWMDDSASIVNGY